MAKRGRKNVAPRAGQTDDEGYEIVGGDGQAMAVGEVVYGAYGGVVRKLPPLRKGAPPANVYAFGTRTVVGGAVLDRLIADSGVKVGMDCKLTRLPDGRKKKGQNPPKIFQLGIKRAGSAGRKGR